MTAHHPTISVTELSADDAEAAGHDPTLRGEAGPLVAVEITTGGHTTRIVGVLVEARISPEHVGEV